MEIFLLYFSLLKRNSKIILISSFVFSLSFQVENGSSAASAIHPSMTNSNRSSNRFSNDFSTLDIHLVSTSSDASNKNGNNKTRWKCGNAANDLHSTFNQTVLPYNNGTASATPAAVASDAVTVATTSSTSPIVDASTSSASATFAQHQSDHLPGNDLTQSKPHASSHESIRVRSPLNLVALPGATRAHNGVGEQASAANEISSANVLVPKHAPFSRDRLFNANVSSTAHAFFDFLKFKRNSESNNSSEQQQQQHSSRCGPSSVSELERCLNNSVNSGGAMRLNVPAATAATDATVTTAESETSFGSTNQTNNTCSTKQANNNGNRIVSASRSTTANVTTMSNHILENGTLMGAIVSQPSLTIHVNHPNSIEHGPRTNGNNNSHQMRNVVNQSAGGVSIVNCYRAVPVQIVNTTSASESVHANPNNTQIVNNQMNHIRGASKVGKNAIEKNLNEKCDIECNGIDNDVNDLVSVNAIDVVALDTNNALNTNTGIQSRTFTSTEAQTDDLQQTDSTSNPQSNPIQMAPATASVATNSTKQNEGNRRNGNGTNGPSAQVHVTDIEALTSREQRRRERRERRLARNGRQQHMHSGTALLPPHHSNCEILPDILHSHVPPPYTTLPMPPHCPINAVAAASPPPSVLVPGPPSALITPIPVGISDDGRYTFPLPIMRR